VDTPVWTIVGGEHVARVGDGSFEIAGCDGR
jgi:hypothetical protein